MPFAGDIHRVERFTVVARHEAGLDLEYPIPADERRHPVLGQPGLECPFVEILVAESGKGRSLSP